LPKPHTAGVTAKDVNLQGFFRAPAAFLKKFGKLKLPKWALSSCPSIKSLLLMIRTGSTHEHFHRVSLWLHQVGSMTKIYGGQQTNSVMPSHFS
uniref:Uncharacterized protein n=1 Tax=Lynx canadensis TaxID=61383 RepID=A0A667IMG0_LYNCA